MIRIKLTVNIASIKYLNMRKISAFLFVMVFVVSCNNRTEGSTVQDVNSSENESVDSRKIAFQNGEFIYCYDFSTGVIKELVKGFDPCISPDGEWVAFTESKNSGNDFKRVINLVNVESSLIQNLEIKDDNHYGAIWSPDGKFIAFSIMKENWQLGLIKPDKTGFKVLELASDKSLYSPTWSRDGEFIFAHNLNVLYKINTNGELIEKYDLKKMFGNDFFFSSSTQFFMMLDHNTLIFEAEIDEIMDGFDGQLSAVFTYNLSTKETQRITKKGFCSSGLWIDEQDRIYFSGFEKSKEPHAIFQTNLNENKPTKIIEKGHRPSIGQ